MLATVTKTQSKSCSSGDFFIYILWQYSKWKFEFTGPNKILEFIFIYIVLNKKNWELYWSQQSFTDLGLEDQSSSWELLWVQYYFLLTFIPFLIIFSNFFILSILTLTSNATITVANQNGAKKMLKNNAICSGKLVTYSFPEEKISCVNIKSCILNNYTPILMDQLHISYLILKFYVFTHIYEIFPFNVRKFVPF